MREARRARPGPEAEVELVVAEHGHLDAERLLRSIIWPPWVIPDSSEGEIRSLPKVVMRPRAGRLSLQQGPSLAGRPAR